MKDTIRELFDYQRFSGNEKLDRLISKTGWKYSMGDALSDDALELVAAAGEPMAGKKVNNHNADDDRKSPG